MKTEEEAEVDELLRQIAQAKQKELRLRAEKKRIRNEIGQLQAGALYSREDQTHKQLADVRRAREDLDAQREMEAEKLIELSANLKEQELKFRKTKSSPFQQAAVSLVSSVQSGALRSEFSEKTNDDRVLAEPTKDATSGEGSKYSPLGKSTAPGCSGSVSGNQQLSTREYDALQRLVGTINSEEQQKRIERLQTELQKASLRHQDENLSLPLVEVPSRTLFDDFANLDEHQSGSSLQGIDSTPPTLLQREFAFDPRPFSSKQLANAREIATDFLSLNRQDASSKRALDRQPSIAEFQLHNVAKGAPPTIMPAPMQPVQCSLPMIPFAVSPYACAHYGVGYPQPYFPGCLYPPAVPPWLPQSVVQHFPGGAVHDQTPKSALREQEDKLQRLERELEMLRIASEQTAEAKEFSRLQDHLQKLQTKISTLTLTDDGVDLANDISSGLDGATVKALKKQHLESLTKVRNERDLLEEQEKLEDLKDQIQRRREEKKRELDNEDWIAQQKRELISLRLQRAIERDEKLTDLSSSESREPYNPEKGFVLFWDYASGFSTSVNALQITYAIFNGRFIQTPFKVVSSRETKTITPHHNQCSFAASRHVKKLPTSQELRVIMEVSSVVQSAAGGPCIPTSLGWTSFSIFKVSNGDELTLACGFFKLPVKEGSMPDPSKSLVVPPSIRECGDMRIHIRLVAGQNGDEASRMLLDPELHEDRYQLPENRKLLSRTQLKDVMVTLPSRTPTGKSTSAETSGPLKSETSPGLTRSPSETTLLVPPQKQDFLDVERLRLMSASPSRPPSTRPRSNIPNTSGEKPRLPAFQEDSDQEKTEPWIRVDKSLEVHRRWVGGNRFQPGDGFNVCIDGGRGFPDSVTLSKLTIAALHADRTQVFAENGSAFAATTSNAFDPVFDMYVEYRQSSFNPTLTLVIRVDTIELLSKQPAILGYGVFPVFLDGETRDQPSRPSILQYILNEGGFQLPLHTQIQTAEANRPLNAKSCEEFPRVPCATVLLRVMRARMAGDGLALLSRKDLPPQEWGSQGLLSPAPQYTDRVYDSLLSTPSGIEEKIYENRHKNRKPKSVAKRLQQSSLSVTDARDLLQAKPVNYLDLTSALRYDPAIGFRVSVDALHNVKAKGSPFFKVLSSVHPPGSFYQAVRLTGDVYFTTAMNWTSAQTSPEFNDGYMTLRDSPRDNSLVLLFDIRSISRHPKTGAITLKQYGWTFLPVLPNSRSVGMCSIQLPIFQGEVDLSVFNSATTGLNAFVNEIGNEKVKQLSLVAEEGASLFVRLEDPQLPHLSFLPITNATPSKMIPTRVLAKYTYDSAKTAAQKKKSPLTKLLPTNAPEAQFEKDLNQAFASELGIHHLLF